MDAEPDSPSGQTGGRVRVSPTDGKERERGGEGKFCSVKPVTSSKILKIKLGYFDLSQLFFTCYIRLNLAQL